MANESRDPKKQQAAAVSRTLPCEEWEALLVDALDGTLLPTDSAAFEGHTATCTACTELLTRAKQGREWLQFLAQPPVSPDLVTKILAKTTGAAAMNLSHPAADLPVATAVPAWMRLVAPMRRMAEPRLMMTAAMAFFSIALTLNLAGVRLSAVHAADLRPSLLRSNLVRQFVNSKVGVENHIYNLRIFYEMEARVRELKRDSDAQEAPAPQPAPSSSPKGSAHKNGGKSENPHNTEPHAALWGHSVEAALHSQPLSSTPAQRCAAQPGTDSGVNQNCFARPEKDRAEGSLA